RFRTILVAAHYFQPRRESPLLPLPSLRYPEDRVSIWNKREDPPAPRPVSPPPAPAPVVTEVKKEPTPVSSTPYRMPEPESRGGAANVGKSVRIIGQIFTKEDLYVDGDVEGTIESLENKVTVGPNGRVHAGI